MTRLTARLFGVGAFVAAALLTLSADARADPDADPWPFLSTRPDEPTDRDPLAAVGNFVVRPNQSAPFYAYVRNPGDQNWANLRLVLSADADGTDVIAEGTAARVPKGKTVAVKLTLKALVPPSAPPDKPAEKPKEQKRPAAAVGGRVYLLLFDGAPGAGANPVAFRNPRAPAARAVRVAHPREYLTAVAELREVAGALALDVTVSAADRAAFRGPGCKVKLDLRSGAEAPRGTFEAVLAPDGKAVVLRAEGLKPRVAGDRRPDTFFVTADGFERAFWFETDFRTVGNVLAPVTDRTYLGIGVPPFAVPGRPLPVRVEAAGREPAGEPNLLFHRAAAGDPERLTAGLAGPRDVGFTAAVGPGGELVLGSEVRDWVIPVDTAGVFGPRRFTLGVGAAEAEATVTLDATGPSGLRFHRLPRTAVRGQPLTLTATGADPESGVAKAVFYVGEPPAEGKPLVPGRAAVGVAGPLPSAKAAAPPRPGAETPARPASDDRAPTGYTGALLMPDQKGPVTVGARLTNRVGLTEEITAEVLLVDPPTTGSIKGTVVQGASSPRPQPGVEVVLVEEGAKPDAPPVATTKTDGSGAFTLANLKPGKYVIRSAKPTDYGAKAEQKVAVEAGEKPTEVTLTLRR
jgi:hypothetical protein